MYIRIQTKPLFHSMILLLFKKQKIIITVYLSITEIAIVLLIYCLFDKKTF